MTQAILVLEVEPVVVDMGGAVANPLAATLALSMWAKAVLGGDIEIRGQRASLEYMVANPWFDVVADESLACGVINIQKRDGTLLATIKNACSS